MARYINYTLIHGQCRYNFIHSPLHVVFHEYVTISSAESTQLLLSLYSDYATKVHDIILTPPADNAYNQLKEQFIKCTVISKQHCLQQQVSTKELRDRKPSQLLWWMQQLLGDKAATFDKSFL